MSLMASGVRPTARLKPSESERSSSPGRRIDGTKKPSVRCSEWNAWSLSFVVRPAMSWNCTWNQSRRPAERKTPKASAPPYLPRNVLSGFGVRNASIEGWRVFSSGALGETEEEAVAVVCED